MATQIITNLNPNIYPSIINFRGFAYFIDGDNIPYYFNENGSWVWMHQDPTTDITTDETGAGTMNGVYKYMYTEINRASGDTIYACHETNPSPIYTTSTLVNKKVALTLPNSGVNSFTTHLKIYGTDASGDVFYYLGNVEIGITDFEDDDIPRDANVAFGKLTEASDGVIDQTYLNYPVKNHRFSVATKSRILVCGIKKKTDGTVDVTNGNATVDGTDTIWTRTVVGDYFQKDGDTRKYLISAWVSATEITLSEEYAGSTSSGDTYIIAGEDDIVRWSAKHPNTAAPLPWSFPLDFYKRIISKDHPKDANPSVTGCNKIGDQPVVFKQKSHYLLTENEDDYLIQEGSTKVGTCSHWSIVETSENGTLIFMTYEGFIYETTGLEAHDLNIDLSKTVDGINKARLQYVQATWVDENKWYILLYSSEGSDYHDRVLVYDYRLKEWIIWAIRANCIAVVESSESGQNVFKPWIGTVGGFVYKMLTGNNLGAGTSGTITGTATSFGSATLTDSGATFNTTDDGHKDVYVSLFDTNGDFQEEQKISSNTVDTLTVDTNWTSSPQAGWTYEIGSIRWHWKSKVFDWDVDTAKSVSTVLLNFKKLSSSHGVNVKFYFSDDPDMVGDTENQSIEFDLSFDYYEPLGLYDNLARYCQFEISGHGVDTEVIINNLLLEFEQHVG